MRAEELLRLAYALEKPSEHPLARAMVLYAAGGIGADAVKESAELVSGFKQVPGQAFPPVFRVRRAMRAMRA